MIWSLILGMGLASSLSQSAFAADVIVDLSELENLRSRVFSGPLYRKRLGLVRERVYPTELGEPITPFLRNGNRSQIFFRKDKRCFRVDLDESESWVSPADCEKKTPDLRLADYPDFRPISPAQAAQAFATPVTYESRSEEVSWRAYLHTKDMIELDRTVLRDRENPLNHPVQPLSVRLRYRTEVAPDWVHGVVIRQELEVTAGEISVLPETKKRKVSEFRSRPGDLFFESPRGEMILFRAPRRSLMPSLLAFPEAYWTSVRNRSLASEHGPVCYRDAGGTPPEWGCHALAFPPNNTQGNLPFTLLLFSITDRRIEILR